MTHRKYTKLAAALAVGLTGSYACAAGFQLQYQNLSGLGNAYAGSAAVAENASTVFFNPAGMTQLKEREFSAGVAVVVPSLKFTDNGSSVGVLTGTGNGGDAGHTAVVPNAYMSWALSKDLYVGLGFGAPFGSKSEFSSPWVGSAQANSFAIETININPSIAYRVSDTVSVGAGINYQKIDATYKRTAGVLAAPFPLSTSTVTAKFGGDAWGWNAGALFKLSPASKLGVSYRSSISYDTTGDITVTGPSAALNAARTSGAKASLKLPDMLILSATHQVNDKWELLGDVSWTGWSSIPKLDLVRTSGASNGAIAQTLVTDFRDSYRVAVGANYQYRQGLKLKMGLAYDQTPVKGATTRLVSLPDNDRTQVAAGAQWTLASGSTLDVGLSYLMVADASVDNNQTGDFRGRVTGNFNGSNAWILGVQYSMPF